MKEYIKDLLDTSLGIRDKFGGKCHLSIPIEDMAEAEKYAKSIGLEVELHDLSDEETGGTTQ